MRRPRPIIGATLSLTLALGACSAAGNLGGSPSAQASASPTPKPAAIPTQAPAATPAPLPSPSAIELLWEAHGPVTSMTSTAYVAINPVDGNVWVGVPFENLFWIFSPDGEYLESWGKAGAGPGQFDFSDHAQNPNGFTPIAFAPDGSFVVGDTGNNRVELFNAQRAFVRKWGEFGTADGQFVQIDSIATDGTTVYVGDGDHYNIQAFDMQGTYLRTFGGDGGFSCVSVDAEGRVHATNPENPGGATQALAIFGPDGAEVARTSLAFPSAWAVQLAVDDAGNSFVPLEQDGFPFAGRGVVRLDAAGEVTGMWEGGGDFIAVSPEGDAIYVTKGINLDTSQWTFVRKYALPGS